MIKDFVLNETITAFLSVRRREIKEYSGNNFISLEFGDASGRIAGVWWEPDRFGLEELQEGDVVKVRGTVSDYRGKPQLKIERLRPAKDDEYSLEEILPRSKFSEEELSKRIQVLTDRIENSHIKRLVESFWSDEEFMQSYLRAAAGKLWHHACIGGLAEHSANVAEICLDMSKKYSFLDRDLLIFGGLFHDMGKVSQYSIKSYIDYSDEGRLIGHICWADHIIAKRAEAIESFPPHLLMKLRHLIISHQGQLDYASPIVPQIPEAFVVFYADEIDSKMGAIERIKEKSGEGWSEYVKLLDRFLYLRMNMIGPSVPSSNSPAILEARRVTRTVSNHNGTINIVDNLSYSFRRGQVYNIVGPSGAGKSSFLRLLNRLDDPTDGELFYNDRPIVSYLPTELRKKVAMIFQIPYIFPGTVKENLEYCCPGGRSPKGSNISLGQRLELVGLNRDFENKNAADLSVGEKQRVAIARTLVLEPEILLLDEPTSALDPTSAQRIEQLILSLTTELGLTPIMVTHNPEQAKRMGGETLLLVKGKLIESGKTDEVLINPRTDLGLKYINKELV